MGLVYAFLSQLEEETDSKSVQFGFESQVRHYAQVAEWNMHTVQVRGFVGSTPTLGTYLSFQKVFQQVSLWKASRYG